MGPDQRDERRPACGVPDRPATRERAAPAAQVRPGGVRRHLLVTRGAGRGVWTESLCRSTSLADDVEGEIFSRLYNFLDQRKVAR